jgi:hypothetical protein
MAPTPNAYAGALNERDALLVSLAARPRITVTTIRPVAG